MKFVSQVIGNIGAQLSHDASNDNAWDVDGNEWDNSDNSKHSNNSLELAQLRTGGVSASEDRSPAVYQQERYVSSACDLCHV